MRYLADAMPFPLVAKVSASPLIAKVSSSSLVAKVSLANAIALEAPLPPAHLRCYLVALACILCTHSLAAAEAPLPMLHEVFANDFLTGVSLDCKELATPHQHLLTHFNAITPENDMKWERLQPSEGQFNFEAADALVDYAEKHKKGFTMHTLVWHRQTPDWVFKDTDGNPAPRELAIARLRNHINVVMQRYRGRVAGWDVVNEALSDAPNEYLRDSPWLRTIGEDYVALAFKFAREADPDAKLYYNDYAIEYPHKREKMVRLVKDLKAAGAAPDAVNLQGHFSIETPSIAEIERTLEAIAGLGLRANISELDVSLFNPLQTGNPYPESAPAVILEQQAQRYGELFSLFLRHDAKLDRVTFWNLHDGVTWLNNHPVPGRKDYPLLFDHEGKPKPAFFRVIKAASK